jgi:hypothetical protein
MLLEPAMAWRPEVLVLGDPLLAVVSVAVPEDHRLGDEAAGADDPSSSRLAVPEVRRALVWAMSRWRTGGFFNAVSW